MIHEQMQITVGECCQMCTSASGIDSEYGKNGRSSEILLKEKKILLFPDLS